MENREIAERFANRLENAIDPQDIVMVATDIELLLAVTKAAVLVEDIVKDLRSAANTQEGE